MSECSDELLISEKEVKERLDKLLEPLLKLS